MHNRFLRILLVVLALGQITLPTPPAFAAEVDETSEAYSFRIEVERHLEGKLNTVLREVTGMQRLVAVVDAEVSYPGGQDADKLLEQNDKSGILFLPGVPARTGTTYYTDSTGRPQLAVTRLSVKVMVNRDVSSSLTQLAHDVAISLVGFNPDRGDTLEVVQMDFIEPQGSEVPGYLLALSLGAIIFMGAASYFFISPYRRLTEALKAAGIGSHPEGQPAQTRMAEHMTTATLELRNTAASQEEAPKTSPQSERPFGFLEDVSLNDLLFALRELEPDHIATVLNYLPPALAADVLGSLDEDVRAEAVGRLINTRELNAQRTETLREKLRDRLKYTAGGPERLMKILENSEDYLRDTLMDSIEKKDHEVAGRLSRGLSTFENIIRTSRAETVDALVRQFPPALFARVLASSSGDVQSKVLDSLGKGASELMREELKYSRPLSAIRLRDEKRRIVQRYREMTEAGLVDDDTRIEGA